MVCALSCRLCLLVQYVYKADLAFAGDLCPLPTACKVLVSLAGCRAAGLPYRPWAGRQGPSREGLGIVGCAASAVLKLEAARLTLAMWMLRNGKLSAV